MSLHSLGKVTTNSGTLVRLTLNQTDATKRYPAHSFLIEALSSNTGRVWIGSLGFNRTTGAGTYCYLAIPTNNVAPSFSATVSYAPAAFNLAEVWLDVEVNGEGVIVSAVVA